jgi:DNA-directed RNA polymerase
MIVPPKPWLSADIGGYLSHRVHVMRFANDYQKQALRSHEREMQLVYKALSVLGQVPWRVNRGVYEVMMAIWESGGGVGKLPSRIDKELPPAPDQSLETTPIPQMTVSRNFFSDVLNCDVF